MASSKHHPPLYAALAIILILGSCAGAWAVEFARGTGEPNDPYQIATAEQLIAISSDWMLSDRHFVLVADIDLDPNLPGRKVFQEPIVQFTVPRLRAVQDRLFHGSFNGGGHIIRNCVFYNTSGAPYTGFFGGIAPEGIVRDLRLEDTVIENLPSFALKASYVGILAADNWGTVVGCSATGVVAAYAGGGLIGRNTGLVAGCHACCDIFGEYIGGLIGVNEAAGRVVLCESDGTLYGGLQAGGLVATNVGTIQYCNAAGFVSGPWAGGLVGDNSGSVRESFATATVSGTQYAGGMASSNEGTIVNCYVTGLIAGWYCDGLVALNTGTILSSYATMHSQAKASNLRLRSLSSGAPSSGYDVDSGELEILSDAVVSASGERVVRHVYYLDPGKPAGETSSPDSSYGVALSQEQMKQASSFVGFDFYGDANDGPAGHWFMPPDGYPVLTWQTQITGLVGVADVSGLSPEQAGLVLETVGLEPNGVAYDYAKPIREVDSEGKVIAGHPAGYLSPGSPVEIVVSLGRYDFSKNPGDGSEANPYQIATAGQLDSLYEGMIPPGRHVILTADIDLSDYVYPGPLIRQVLGEFDGNGHTIRGLQGGHGLFGDVASGATVRDLIIDQARLDLGDFWGIATGILADENHGHIFRCQATGQILGNRQVVGGLVGRNVRQLTDCRFSGRIQLGAGSSYIGGLVGSNMGSIVRCCARDVDVSGGDHVGGLVGENGYATGLVEACYATGMVQGVNSVGGLVGRNGIPPRKPRKPPRSILMTAEITASADPNANGVVRDCYAACSVTGQQGVGGLIGLSSAPETTQESSFFLDPKDGGGPDNGLGTPLTASQMKQQASFTGWDFIDTWVICEGKGYPRLRWEGVECDVGN